MTTMITRLQNHMLTNINNAAAIDFGYSQGLVSHELILKQGESQNVQPVDVGLDGCIIAR